MAAKGGKGGGSKNNIANRGSSARIKEVNGKQIVPVEYRGANVGHGNYMAGKYADSGLLVKDENKVPIPYQLI